MGAQAPTVFQDVRAASEAYCVGIHTSNVDLFKCLCHEGFHMSARAESGAVLVWTKADYLDRVAGRAPFEGDPKYEILDVEASGNDIARVRLRVSVPPRIYEDYLGFIRIDGEWKLINKLFRVLEGPALEG